MSRFNEISSTERLLDLIRENRDTDSKISPQSSRPERKPKRSPRKLLGRDKGISIGIDIDHSELRLVKIDRFSSRNPQLLDYRSVPFEDGLSQTSPQFNLFLKSALTRFCGSSEKIELWSAFPASEVDVRYIKIPRVPRHQIANSVYWTYQKHFPFNEKNVIFDYELLGETTEGGAQKIEALAYSAPKQDIENLKARFEKSGFPLSGITIVPFAFQNFLKSGWIEPLEPDVCSLCIGMDWSSISIFKQKDLMLARGIRAGMGSMIEAIRDNMGTDAANNAIEMAGEEAVPAMLENKEAPDTDQAHRMLLSLVRNTGVEQPPAQTEAIFAAIRPVLKRLAGQTERTLKHYTLNFGKRNIGRLYISGELSAYPPLVEYIREQLDLPVESVDPFAAAAAGDISASVPETASEKICFSTATGLALATNAQTPNFIFTHKDKAHRNRIRAIDRALVGLFLVITTACSALYLVQGHLIEKKTAHKEALQQQLAACRPNVDQNLILQQVARIKENQLTLAEYGKKYLCMAIISELTALTPADVRLLRLNADLVRKPTGKKGASKRSMVLEGVVFGNRQSFDSTLAGYLVNLKSSPLFGRFIVESRSFELLDNKEIMRFKGHLELG